MRFSWNKGWNHHYCVDCHCKSSLLPSCHIDLFFEMLKVAVHIHVMSGIWRKGNNHYIIIYDASVQHSVKWTPVCSVLFHLSLPSLSETLGRFSTTLIHLFHFGRVEQCLFLQVVREAGLWRSVLLNFTVTQLYSNNNNPHWHQD